MYDEGCSAIDIARAFNAEGIKPPSQVWHEKGLRKAAPKGGVFLWQHSGIHRILKNKAYTGDLVQGEKGEAVKVYEGLKKECQAALKAIEAAKEMRMAGFEAYALGETESFDPSTDEVDALRAKYEGLMECLSQAEDRVREYDRVKVRESFAVLRLTRELLDEYVDRVIVHSEDDIEVVWK